MTDLFQTLSPKEKTRIYTKSYARNALIFSEGSLCDTFCLVEKGLVSISSFTSQGREIIYNLIEEGGVFGNNLLFSSSPYYKGDVIARKDSTVCFIRKEDLLSLFQNNRQFLEAFLQIEADFAKRLNYRIKLLSFTSAKERILFALENKRGELKYDSVTLLAQDLSLERETLSRCLSDLQKRGIITREHKTIRLNK